LEQIAWASKDIQHQVTLGKSQTQKEFHRGVVVLYILQIHMGYLRDPEAAVRQHQHIWVVDEHILVNEEKNKAHVDAQVQR
jgi:hypothetical protein